MLHATRPISHRFSNRSARVSSVMLIYTAIFASMSCLLLLPRCGVRALSSSSFLARHTTTAANCFVRQRSLLAKQKRKINASSSRMFSSNQIDLSSLPSFSNGFEGEEWEDVLPLQKGSHNSAKVQIPSASAQEDQDDSDIFSKSAFRERLNATVTACRELGKSSLWVEVPMDRASLIEDMCEFGFQFHHAEREVAVLNVWLKDTESKIPNFATHNVGVGGVVVNSRNEILCVKELRTNYLKWKTPTGHTELGEQIDEAIEREVWEETKIRAKFHSILSFRQTHGLAHGRSDLFFVCRVDPIEGADDNGNPVVDDPVAQECEIAEAAWVPLSEYKSMIHDGEKGHPMMRHVIDGTFSFVVQFINTKFYLTGC